ncbi:MAG: 23S rRNA (adenine(2503)-C(2))-methyltransferase RlmN [Armatimonadota bacterium]|nr:23S rRNA (adenine(2503)-C(2))-methyltransferase RlmN [Armatimonadota bacterium]MDR7533937.1 23S rRNA (adenine(2503)-C(2))-methyltransferase RlmN [Armatimonadota bacterium]MDR7536049.1 23S rRNA (adenine(2503)-C(2))-methyltransferase RlmN [Armatimonadota bacterium]
MPTGPTEPTDLPGLTLDELEAFARALGEPAYRGRQLARWIYQRRAASFEGATDLPASLRARLAAVARLPRLAVLERRDAASGSTTKFLCGLPDGQAVETVLMRYDDGRRTACVSTQVGCGMGCAFCATGLAGLQRNLTAGEIVDQVQLIAQETAERPTHVVFMGMGEPLANYEATVRAVRLLNAPWGLGIGMRHLTISTVGLVPQIRRLAAERFQLTLAISLHAPDDALRDRLVPVNRRWPIADLLAAAREYAAATGRRVTFEYVLMAGTNDTDAHARALGRLLAGERAHLNVIPWNPVYGLQYRRPPEEAVRRFARIVRAAGVPVTVRIERGVEIDAACGQLRRTQPVPTPVAHAGSPG